MLIEQATTAVHVARKRHHSEIVERTRLRRLISRIDEAIEACEETHLQGIKEVTPELVELSERVFTFARRTVRLTGDEAALTTVNEMLERDKTKITDLMDSLWAIQESMFDVMLPWRVELPEDVELPSTIAVGEWDILPLHV